MRKFLFSGCFILVGVGLWIALSNTARFSLKKWDAKFATVLRHNLHNFGLTDKDIISSVNKVQKDQQGQWVIKTITFQSADIKLKNRLKKNFENSGADVIEHVKRDKIVLLVKRGSRVYQEIHMIRSQK